MPIIDEKAPTVGDFDAMLEMLRAADDNTACVFNCQVNITLIDDFLAARCLFQAVSLNYLKQRHLADK